MIKEVAYYRLVCDKCGRELEEGFFGVKDFPTIDSAIKTAVNMGWNVSKDKTVCSKCSKPIKAEKQKIKGCPF